jgi:hypothetical protein
VVVQPPARFDIYISDAVLREAARGDESAAAKRLEERKGVEVLDLDDGAEPTRMEW